MKAYCQTCKAVKLMKDWKRLNFKDGSMAVSGKCSGCTNASLFKFIKRYPWRYPGPVKIIKNNNNNMTSKTKGTFSRAFGAIQTLKDAGLNKLATMVKNDIEKNLDAFTEGKDEAELKAEDNIREIRNESIRTSNVANYELGQIENAIK